MSKSVIRITYSISLNDARIEEKSVKIRKEGDNDFTNLNPMRIPLTKEQIFLHTLLTKVPLGSEVYDMGYLVLTSPDEDSNDFVFAYWVYDKEDTLLAPFQFVKVTGEEATKEYWERIKGIVPNELKAEGPLTLCFTNRIYIRSFEMRDENILLELERNFSAFQYVRGKFCVSLPLPGRKPDAPDKEIVIYGERVQNNLEKICQNLDLKLKHLFICADPGLGKEVYSSLVHYGTGRKGDLLKVDMTTPLNEVEAMLKGCVTEKGIFVPGSFEKAANGTIIFDEIDKVTGNTREQKANLSFLLRPLDPGVYYPQDGWEERKIEDVAMIFVGTKAPKELEDKAIPEDFFTRVSEPAVKLEHPLPQEFSNEYDFTLTYLVRLFYWQAVEEMACLETGLKSDLGADRRDKILAGKVYKEAMSPAEKRCTAILTKWLGRFDDNLSDEQRFLVIQTLRFSVIRSTTGNRPSVRSLRDATWDFVRENWYDAKLVPYQGGDLQKLVISKKKGQETSISDALAQRLKEAFNLRIKASP